MKLLTIIALLAALVTAGCGNTSSNPKSLPECAAATTLLGESCRTEEGKVGEGSGLGTAR